MEILYETELSVPLIQLLLLLTLSSLAMLFHKIKVALIINYLFALYWGYILNVENIVGESLSEMGTFEVLYFGFGILIIVLVLIGLHSQGR